MTFDFSKNSWPVPTDLGTLFSQVWNHIAQPGTTWSGPEAIAIARASRAARYQSESDSYTDLPRAALDASARLASRPALVSQEWVQEITAAIGEPRYVELVGILSAVTAVDTITMAIGHGLEPLPSPVDGPPFSRNGSGRLRRNRTWVSMAGQSAPRQALSSVPRTHDMVNTLLNRLFETREASREHGPIRNLTRSQAELVVVAVSYANECFY